MEVIKITDMVGSLQDNYVAVMGELDGVHIGHQELLKKISDFKRRYNGAIKSAVITFEPHPDIILNKCDKFECITPLKEKLKILESYDIDSVFIIKFDDNFATISPESFVEEYLNKLNIKIIVVGPDFKFGNKGLGNADTLRKLGIQVEIVEELQLEKKKIGSFMIKNKIKEGNIEEVTELLGRPYQIIGKVCEGHRVGRTIGFPTANVALYEPYVIPKRGVYVVDVIINNCKYRGVCNIGHNPTINYNDNTTIEVNILNFKDDVYGKIIKVLFLKYVRDEKKFNTKEALIKQIEADANLARGY